MNALANRLREFARRSSGGVTIEYVLWLPVMAGLMMLTVDATALMHTQTELYDAARSTSREVAVGKRTPDAARTALLARLGNGRRYQAQVQSTGGFVTTTISVPFSDVVVFGSGLTGGTLAGRAVMYVESAS